MLRGRLAVLLNTESGSPESFGTRPKEYERTASKVGLWLTYLRASGKSPRTIEGYRDGIGRFLSLAPMLGIPNDPAALTRHHVAAYLAALADAGQSDYTRYNRWATLSAFLGWLVEEGELATNPCHGLRPKRKDDAMPLITGEQLQRLRALCMVDSLRAREVRDLQAQGAGLKWGTRPEGLRNWAIFILLRGTGLRASELLNLEMRDVDVDEGILVVREAKGGKSRKLYLEDPVLLALGRYLQRARGMDPGPLFLPLTGGRRKLQRFQLRKLCAQYGERAGFSLHPHMFRHTFAVRYLLAGGDPRTLQILLGHESLTMVMRYVRAIDQADAVAKHRELRPLARLGL